MVRYGIFTIYKCGRTKTHYIDAEDREVMWDKFYKHHDKNKIEDAGVYSEKTL